MNRLEEKLREVYRRKEPPAEFSQRVLRRIRETSAGREEKRAARPAWLFLPRFSWMAAAAMLLLLIGVGALRYRQLQQEQRQGEEAKQQLLLALHITGGKIQQIHRLLQTREP